jgi:thiamine biosynthesis protein ThiI
LNIIIRSFDIKYPHVYLKLDRKTTDDLQKIKSTLSIVRAMKAVSLMSDGIDSPVATYLMAKKGVEVVVLHGRNRPDANIEKVRGLVARIAEASGAKVDLASFDHFPNQEAFMRADPKWFHCILCKRMMVRVASNYSKAIGGEFIIMGDSLGQVASQTLENIRLVEDASVLPIIRPLIGLDKREIEGMARSIGTYEGSIVDQDKCAYVPSKPSIKGNMKAILRCESASVVESLLKSSLDSIVDISV